MIKVKNYIYKATKFVKKHRSLIFTIATGVSTAVSLYLTAKTALEVENVLNNEDLSKNEKRNKIIFKSFPVATAVIASYTLLICNYIYGEKTKAGLLAVIASNEEMFRAYRQKVKNEQGEDKELELYSETIEEQSEQNLPVVIQERKKTIFCEPITGTFFDADIEDVILAEYEANRLFILRGEIAFNDWLVILGLNKLREDGNDFGWSALSYVNYGYNWIDFEHRPYTDSAGQTYYMIRYVFPPHYDYQDPYDETCGINELIPEYKIEG